MGRIAGHYEWDDDALRPGQRREGGLHQNLFDAGGNLKGSARFVPADGGDPDRVVVTETVYVPVNQRRRTPDEEALAEAIADLVSHLVSRGFAAARPHVQKWWQATARPAIDAGRAKMRGRRPRRRAPKVALPGDRNVGPSLELARTREDDRPLMSRAEAQARYLAALAARAYSDEQMRLVTSARIVGGQDVDELEASLSQLPPAQIQALIEAMVTDPSMLSEDTLAELASVLGRRGSLLGDLG